MPGGIQVRSAFSGSPLAKWHRDNGLLTEKVHGHTSETDKTHVQLKCRGWRVGSGESPLQPCPRWNGLLCVCLSHEFPDAGVVTYA